MSVREQLFNIQGTPEDLILELARSFHLAACQVERRKRIYLDSFDWGLFAKGLALFWESSAPGATLTLSRLDGEVLGVVARARSPQFPGEIPPSALRRKVAAAVGVRRLLSRVAFDYSGWEVRILDGREKQIGLVRIPQGTVRAPFRRGRPKPLPLLAAVLSVRGFEAAHCDLVAALGGLPVTTPVTGTFFETLLGLAGETPLDYSSKLKVQLGPEMPASEALKLLFGGLLGTMGVNRLGAARDLDPEFLHDLRVAVRRTRSLLGQFRVLMDPAVLERFSTEFRWLGQATNAKRDLDVFLIRMEKLQEKGSTEVADDLEPLIRLLESRRKRERAALAEVMGSERLRDLLAEWSAEIRAGSAFQPAAEKQSVQEAASRRIWKIYRGILKRGRGLGPSAAPPLLHRLRIECKKLRYLLEFFRGLYDPMMMSALISDLKGLQDILGEFNDCFVQNRNLRAYVEEAWAEQKIPAQTFLVAGKLLQQIESGQNELRLHFAEKFCLFADRKRKKVLKRALFRKRRGLE